LSSSITPVIPGLILVQTGEGLTCRNSGRSVRTSKSHRWNSASSGFFGGGVAIPNGTCNKLVCRDTGKAGLSHPNDQYARSFFPCSEAIRPFNLQHRNSSSCVRSSERAERGGMTGCIPNQKAAASKQESPVLIMCDKMKRLVSLVPTR